MIDAEKKQRILILRAKGRSYASIAGELRIGKQTAIDVCKDNEVAITTLKGEELKELYETCKVSKEARIEALSSLRDKILAELKQRGFADVPTEKLINQYINILEAIKKETIEPTASKTLHAKTIEERLLELSQVWN